MHFVGLESGLTGKVIQVATGITEPDYGAVFEDAEYAASVIGDSIRTLLQCADQGPGGATFSRRISPVEIVTIFDVLRATKLRGSCLTRFSLPGSKCPWTYDRGHHQR